MRTLAAFACSFAALGLALSSGACGTASDLLPDTGMPDAGPFSVSGTVALFPLSTSWFAAQGMSSPSRNGLPVRLEDPFVAARMPDAGVDRETSVGEDGRFSFSDIDGMITVGLAAQVIDFRNASVLQSVSFLFEGGPRSVSNATAWMLPIEFGAALAKATKIADLGTQGYLLGVVLDAEGKPVSGVGVVGHDLDNTRVRYLADDLSIVPDGNATTVSGAFLVPGTLDLMNFSVVGHDDYAQRKARVLPGQAFLVVFRP